MTKITAFIGSLVLLLVGITTLSFLFAVPVYYLWNGCLVGLIEGIKPLASVWQAWGLSILCGLLIKSSVSSSK